MSALPVTSPTTDKVYFDLGEALRRDDDQHGWALFLLLAAVLHQLDEFATIVQGEDGWSLLFDPDTAPAWALPWLGQWVGITIPATLTEAQARARFANPAHFYRGTPDHVAAAAREQLTGSRRVTIEERYGADPNIARVAVYASQMLDLDLLTRAAEGAAPWEIALVIDVLAGQTWDDLQAAHATWADVTAAYASWDDLLEDV
jgi:hypothetical protein